MSPSSPAPWSTLPWFKFTGAHAGLRTRLEYSPESNARTGSGGPARPTQPDRLDGDEAGPDVVVQRGIDTAVQPPDALHHGGGREVVAQAHRDHDNDLVGSHVHGADAIDGHHHLIAGQRL